MRKPDHLNLSGRTLTLFLAVYDTNSVSRAAEQLDVNQSSVSHGLDSLREIFDDRLFVKSGRGIAPTERAIALAPSIRSLLASMEGMIDSSQYNPALDDQPITLAGNIDALSELFMQVRDRMFEAAPQIKIHLIEAGSRSSVEGILERRQADVVLAARGRYSSGLLISKTIKTSKIVCYTDPRARKPVHSLKAYAAARHAVVDFGRPGKSIVDEALEEKNLHRNIVLRAPSFFALAKMMEGTDLVATMPEYLSKTVFSSLSKHRSPMVFPNVDVDMVWHRRSDASARNIWIREMISASAAGKPKRSPRST